MEKLECDSCYEKVINATKFKCRVCKDYYYYCDNCMLITNKESKCIDCYNDNSKKYFNRQRL